jgi:hypothetical protein
MRLIPEFLGHGCSRHWLTDTWVLGICLSEALVECDLSFRDMLVSCFGWMRLEFPGHACPEPCLNETWVSGKWLSWAFAKWDLSSRDMLVSCLGWMRPEFPGHACPRPWLNELMLDPTMSAFPGLNQVIPSVAYSRE